MRACRLGFTIVELMVVIAIIALLFAMIFPAIQKVRESANRLQCQSQLRQIGVALHHYSIDYSHLPPGRRGDSLLQSDHILSWMVLLSPYYEQSTILQDAEAACKINRFTNKNPPHTWLVSVPRLLTCPTDGRLSAPLIDVDGVSIGCSSYLGVIGSGRHSAAGRLRDGLFGAEDGLPGFKLTDCPDGQSNTLLVGERPPPDNGLAGQWYARIWDSNSPFTTLRGPDQTIFAVEVKLGNDTCSGPFRFGPGTTSNPCDRYHFWSMHQNGANFLFADGSCRPLSYSAQDLIPALASRNGGESVSLDQ